MEKRISAWPAKLAVALLAALAVVALGAGAASARLVYKNVPRPRPEGVPGTGLRVGLGCGIRRRGQIRGSARKEPTVIVDMESYGCQSGSGAACTTTPGATFPVPITLNIYQVGSYGTPLATMTKTFKIPYRPSAKRQLPARSCPKTSKATASRVHSPRRTRSNSASLPPRCRPRRSSRWPTTPRTYGKVPTGKEGPENSLNVGVNADYECAPGKENPVTKECEDEDYMNVSTEAPSIGSDPLPELVFLNTTYSAIDCGGTLGKFGPTGIEPSCNWKFEQPAFEVKAKRK